jgi:hypothetical protein
MISDAFKLNQFLLENNLILVNPAGWQRREKGVDYEWNVAPIPRTKFFSRSEGICSIRLACRKWVISTTPPPRPRVELNRRVNHCERRRFVIDPTPSDINLNRI